MAQYLTGPVYARLATGQTLFTDIRVVFPLAVLATFLVSAIGLRSLSGVVLPLLANAVALLITIAVFIRTGHELNFVTIIMPPVVFVVGFAYAVHVISDYEQVLARGHDKIVALKESLREAFVPLTLTAFTTGIGFPVARNQQHRHHQGVRPVLRIRHRAELVLCGHPGGGGTAIPTGQQATDDRSRCAAQARAQTVAFRSPEPQADPDGRFSTGAVFARLCQQDRCRHGLPAQLSGRQRDPPQFRRRRRELLGRGAAADPDRQRRP